MLSQRISGFIFDYSLTKDEKIYGTLKQDFQEWKSVHYALLEGNTERGIRKVGKGIENQLKPLNPYITKAEDWIEKLPYGVSSEELREVQVSQTFFLKEMDKGVRMLQDESDRKLRTIVRIEIALALLTLFVIFLEVLYVFRPITKNLLSRNQALEQSNKTLEEYAYIASHDLRTPVQNVINFAGLLKETMPDKMNEEEKEFLGYIELNAKKMEQTTRELLQFSTANRIEKENLDVNKLLDKVISEIKRKTKDADIKIEDVPTTIHADKILMSLLFTNLISNGIKYVPEGKKPEIRISGGREKEGVFFRIQDNGIGIPKEKYEEVFKMFKRLSPALKQQGTGIGLALCKRIVEGHGGSIALESKVNEGTEFRFFLPMV